MEPKETEENNNHKQIDRVTEMKIYLIEKNYDDNENRQNRKKIRRRHRVTSSTNTTAQRNKTKRESLNEE